MVNKLYKSAKISQSYSQK